MRVAVLLNDEDFLDDGMTQAYAFTVEDDVITGVGSESLFIKNINYLAMWLLAKNIETVYMNDEQHTITRELAKIKIDVRPLKDIKENPLLGQLLVSNKWQKKTEKQA